MSPYILCGIKSNAWVHLGGGQKGGLQQDISLPGTRNCEQPPTILGMDCSLPCRAWTDANQRTGLLEGEELSLQEAGRKVCSQIVHAPGKDSQINPVAVEEGRGSMAKGNRSRFSNKQNY